jgi:hypothetical protein
MAVEKQTPCYICWFLTISLAIPAGIILTDAIRAGIAYASFDRISNRIAVNTKRVSSSETKTPKLSKIEAPKTDIPTVKLTPKEDTPENGIYIKVLPDKKSAKKDIPKEEMPGYQTTLKTCNFWTKEHKKEATKQNSAYMEAACNRLKTYQ